METDKTHATRVQDEMHATGKAHAARVKEAFAQQAGAFEDDRLNRVFTSEAEWLFGSLPLSGDELLLDVAAGTGHAARSLAGRVKVAIAVDLTIEMLSAGQASAEWDGVGNVVFQRGDALALPFLSGSFDVVVSRFATHHIEEPARQLAEMARCLRPGGLVALADMVADEDGELAASQNELERLRDPSHARMLPVSEIEALLCALGLEQVASQTRPMPRAVEPWLEQAATERAVADEVRRRLRAELEGGSLTGLMPFEQDGHLHYRQVWACVLARKRG